MSHKIPKPFGSTSIPGSKIRPTIDDLQCPDRSTSHTDRDKADTLNKYFTSVFTQENLSTIPSFYIGCFCASPTNCNYYTPHSLQKVSSY